MCGAPFHEDRSEMLFIGCGARSAKDRTVGDVRDGVGLADKGDFVGIFCNAAIVDGVLKRCGVSLGERLQEVIGGIVVRYGVDFLGGTSCGREMRLEGSCG